jgi:hypothetical protein
MLLSDSKFRQSWRQQIFKGVKGARRAERGPMRQRDGPPADRRGVPTPIGVASD